MHAGDDRSQQRRQLQAQIVAMQGVVDDASKMYRNIKIAQYRASMHPAKHLKKPHWRKAAVIVLIVKHEFWVRLHIPNCIFQQPNQREYIGS